MGSGSLWRSFLFVAALAVCAAAAVCALFELRASLLLEQQTAAAAALPSGKLREVELKSGLETAGRAADVWLARPQSVIEYARLWKRAGDESGEPKQQLARYCRALSVLGQALRTKPYDAQYLMNWANLRQLLGAAPCAEELTRGDYREAAALALRSDPTSGELKFAAALLALWSGDKPEGLRLFKQVLTYAVGLGPTEQGYIFSQIRNAEDLKAVLPARFPQVTQWAELFQARAPQRFREQELQAAFADLESEALKEAEAEYERGLVPGEIHMHRLLSLSEAAVAPEVISRADGELGRYLESLGLEAEGRYYTQRAALRRLPIIAAALPGDTRPQAGVLAGWGRDGPVYFDRYYSTVGFYLPRGRSARLIELSVPAGAKAPEAQYVRVFVSGDNEEWKEIRDFTLETVEFQGGVLLAIAPKAGHYRYWKVHFNGAQRIDSFGAKLSRMLRVYG